MPDNPKEFYTMGYGVTKKLVFLDRLQSLSNDLGLSLSLIDIRQYGSKSRNGAWCYQGGTRSDIGLYKTIAESGLPVEYHRVPSLANYFPRTKTGLERYRQQLKDYRTSPTALVTKDFINLRERIRLGYLASIKKAVILLCAERKPFKERGQHLELCPINTGIPNCHRVILAEELLEELGDGREVEHL